MLILFVILFPLVCTFGVRPLRRRNRMYRNAFVRIVPAIEWLAVLGLLVFPTSLTLPGVCGLGLQLQTGTLPCLLAVVAASMWAMTGQNCTHYFAHAEGINRFYIFWLGTLGAMMGVFFAADLFTLFVFFEVMGLTSYVWVAQNETPAAIRAGETYLAVAIIGGMSLLAGILLLYNLFGTLEFSAMAILATGLDGQGMTQLYTAGGCCLVGFGAKAGLYPLHIWLPKAHPVAPAPASALLSGILTKSGVFGMLLMSRFLFPSDGAWSGILLALGAITMVLGAVLALCSVDLKRTLACSSMSQIGFITVGLAMQGFLVGENALASWGVVLHMLNHSTIKLVLFVAAGMIYLGAHSLDLNDIRGWGRNKPFLKGVFFIGAASIAGVPGFSGYISKTLLHESIVEYIHVLEHAGGNTTVFVAVEWLFLFSGGLTAAYMTKLFMAIFVSQKAAGQHMSPREYTNRGTIVMLGLGATVLVVLGVLPYVTMNPLAEWAGVFFHADHIHHVPAYFAWVNLKGACISLAIGAVVYLGVVQGLLMRNRNHASIYVDIWPAGLDLENGLYRPMLGALSFVGALLARTAASMGEWCIGLSEHLVFSNAPAIFSPRETENFGIYEKKPMRFLVEETFSFDLLFAATGIVALLLFILLR